MSRSFKKHPCGKFTTARSEKHDKQIASRKLRRAVKIAINISYGEDDGFGHGLSDPWSFDGDGKCWDNNMSMKDRRK